MDISSILKDIILLEKKEEVKEKEILTRAIAL